MKTKIVQITSAEAYYPSPDITRKHMTLFALDSDGIIWTRFYDGKMYREWYPISTQGLPRQQEKSVDDTAA